jgi:hypothetical protein
MGEIYTLKQDDIVNGKPRILTWDKVGCVVNGEDASDIRSININVTAGEITEVTIEKYVGITGETETERYFGTFVSCKFEDSFSLETFVSENIQKEIDELEEILENREFDSLGIDLQ